VELSVSDHSLSLSLSLSLFLSLPLSPSLSSPLSSLYLSFFLTYSVPRNFVLNEDLALDYDIGGLAVSATFIISVTVFCVVGYQVRQSV
jgi:hypothetical protein